MNRRRRWLLVAMTLLISSCGGGGGGGGAPATPSVTVSGVKASYWQDEAVAISFAVANMDAATTNYSISGLDEGYDFTLDSKAGTFRTISDQYTDAGEYSYTITATDGAGKTASRSFQFRVDAVVTGANRITRYDEGQNGRALEFTRSRDGLMGISAAFATFRDGGFVVNNLTCFGETSVRGATISGTVQCGGSFPEAIDGDGLAVGLRAISRIEVELNVNDPDVGSIVFLGGGGEQLEIWRQADLFDEEIENFDGWPNNVELQGRYAFVSLGHQYEAVYSVPEAQNGALSYYDAAVGAVELVIGPDYKISSEISTNSTSACIINGEISQLTLDEYNFVHGDKGYNWRYALRTGSGKLDATNCSSLGLRDATKTIDQPLGPFLFGIQRFQSEVSDVKLSVFGAGIEKPFVFTAWQVCDAEGNSTPFNNAVLQLQCD